MKYNILIGGQAGQGIEFISDIISISLVKEGFYVFNYRYYQSLIKGGHNYNIVSFSKDKVFSFDEEIDFILAFDQNTVNLHKEKLKENGYVICDKSINFEKKLDFDIRKFLSENNISNRYENTVLASYFWKILGFKKDSLMEAYERKGKDSINLRIIEEVFKLDIKPIFNIKPEKRKEKYYLSGSEGIAYGAISAGLDIYFGYPMTPATPVLHILSSLKDKYDILVYQPDNEVGVINMAIGASYAGAKVMVGTSGGGADLMGEGISFSGMAEIPIVIYWAQRYGPSTGLATSTSQEDLLSSIHIGHGEFPKVVVAPGDPAEAYRRTIEAFYLAYKYNIPVIILSDTFLAESRISVDEIEVPNVPIERFINLNEQGTYKLYEITERGYKERAIPGLNAIVKANSYEHDEFGFQIFDDHKLAERMHAKRLIKMFHIEKEIYRLDPYFIYGKGDNLIVSWGSSKMPIMEALKGLKGWRYLHISYLNPFPRKVSEIIEGSRKVLLVENNLTGQLGKLIMRECGIYIENRLLKHNGLPISPAEIIRKIKEIEK
ncbi:MAG: hypothetical protein BXU00_03155 [Candidatus Nanoclepta minutus]|uniref:2-oxoacid:ferredoxin oxidoreductase subunit alpha n=1 Tax=Candidatus Nanoclepta minutus TaxID=1940235 RepID=A0A397WPS7_9ARCH|nr:MAG: hypothetical protein BXU00_03155 [Candidatus Nanoclepta minutus]